MLTFNEYVDEMNDYRLIELASKNIVENNIDIEKIIDENIMQNIGNMAGKAWDGVKQAGQNLSQGFNQAQQQQQQQQQPQQPQQQSNQQAAQQANQQAEQQVNQVAEYLAKLKNNLIQLAQQTQNPTNLNNFKQMIQQLAQ